MATVSDESTGQMLFYNDGTSVWNKLNQPMPNGSGLDGSDYNSAFMGAIIAPYPTITPSSGTVLP
jgi:hypothetical protein